MVSAADIQTPYKSPLSRDSYNNTQIIDKYINPNTSNNYTFGYDKVVISVETKLYSLNTLLINKIKNQFKEQDKKVIVKYKNIKNTYFNTKHTYLNIALNLNTLNNKSQVTPLSMPEYEENLMDLQSVVQGILPEFSLDNAYYQYLETFISPDLNNSAADYLNLKNHIDFSIKYKKHFDYGSDIGSWYLKNKSSVMIAYDKLSHLQKINNDSFQTDKVNTLRRLNSTQLKIESRKIKPQSVKNAYGTNSVLGLLIHPENIAAPFKQELESLFDNKIDRRQKINTKKLSSVSERIKMLQDKNVTRECLEVHSIFREQGKGAVGFLKRMISELKFDKDYQRADKLKVAMNNYSASKNSSIFELHNELKTKSLELLN